jgi:nucleotide-binding universal stress UspA family protein
VYTRILVPLDGSRLAERALPPAEELARLMKAPLYLVRVVDPAELEASGSEATLGRGVSSPLLSDEGAAAQAYLERIVAREMAWGLSASSEVRYGVAAREIVAMTRPGDLLAIGTHDRGGMARWFLGSVAEAVARRSSVPILLARGAGDATDEHVGGSF